MRGYRILPVAVIVTSLGAIIAGLLTIVVWFLTKYNSDKASKEAALEQSRKDKQAADARDMQDAEALRLRNEAIKAQGEAADKWLNGGA